MGELHLDIIKERLLTEYKLDIMLGPIQIAYREALSNSVQERSCIQETIGQCITLTKQSKSTYAMTGTVYLLMICLF